MWTAFHCAGRQSYDEVAMSPTLRIALIGIGFAGSHLMISSLPVRGPDRRGFGEGPSGESNRWSSEGFLHPLVATYLRQGTRAVALAAA